MHAKIVPFKYIKVCKELFALMSFCSIVTFAIKHLTFPTLNFEINKVDVYMYVCAQVPLSAPGAVLEKVRGTILYVGVVAIVVLFDRLIKSRTEKYKY